MSSIDESIQSDTRPARAHEAPVTREAGGDSTGGVYPWYVLGLLTAIYGLQVVDRLLVAILLEPIKKEFGLTDSQLGFVSSFAFGISFALACVPLGLLCDRLSRKRLLAGLLAVWSGFTALSGMAQTYVHLVLARIAVGAAESGNNSCGMSLLSDYFGPRNRATAFGIYFCGQALGIFGGFLLGGIIAAAYGWRVAFFVAGIPGLLLALLLLATVREPRRGAASPAAQAAVAGMAQERYSLRDTLRWLRLQRSAGLMVAANIIASITASGITVWYASFMIRQHGMDVRTAGISIGIGIGLATAIGATAGGLVSDLVGRRGLRFRPLCISAVLLAALPLFAGGLFAGSATLALVLLSAGAAVNSMQFGPTFALIHGLVRPAMRGTTTSLSYLANNLIGYSCGPLLVGMLSDRMQAVAGPQSLRFALCAVMVFQLVGVCLFWRASLSIEHDIRRLNELE